MPERPSRTDRSRFVPVAAVETTRASGSVTVCYETPPRPFPVTAGARFSRKERVTPPDCRVSRQAEGAGAGTARPGSQSVENMQA